MKIKVLIARLCVDGSHRQEIANTLIEITAQAVRDPRIEDLIHMPVVRVPTPVARNCVVKEARAKGVDIICMLDSDMWPAEGFYNAALDFLCGYPGPAVIASPYVLSAPNEKVNVFEYRSDRSSQSGSPIPPNVGALIDNVPRNDAAMRKGIERVANVGTGYIFYKTNCFDRVKHPYFDYDYEDETHTAVIETEDCWAHRRLWEAGVPLFVSWDHWSGHRKSYWAEKPAKLQINESGRYWLELAKEQIRAEHQHGTRSLAALVPADVSGWCDYAELYKQIVDGVKDGAHVVEIGSFMGQSAITMARLIQRSGKRIKFTCIDHFQGDPDVQSQYGTMPANARELFEANLRKYKVEDRVELLPMPSAEAAQLFRDESLDFVFIDGNHSEEAATADIQAYLPKVRQGGVLAGHDFDYLGVVKAVANCFANERAITVMGRCWVHHKRG